MWYSKKLQIFRSRRLGNIFINSVSILYAASGEKFVLKRHKTLINFVKWFALRIFAFRSIYFSILASHRFQNELIGLLFCKKSNINAPKIVLAKNYSLITDYIQGIPLDAFHDKKNGGKLLIPAFYMMGQTLARIHNIGATLGDCKPENVFFINKKQIALIDFDQFKLLPQYKRLNAQLWDLHEFCYYSGHYFPNPNHSLLKQILTAFLKGYFDHKSKNSDYKRFVTQLGSLQYVIPFLFFVQPFTLRKIYQINLYYKRPVNTKK